MRLTFKVFAGSVRLHRGAQGCVLGYTLLLHGFLIIAPEGVWAANGSSDIKGRMSERSQSGWWSGVGRRENHWSDMNANSLIISMYRFKKNCPFFLV